MRLQDIVLNGLLSHGKPVWTEHCGMLNESLFTGDRQQIYLTIESLHTRGRLVDAVTVTEALGIGYNDLILSIQDNWVSVSTLGAHIAELHAEANTEHAREIGAKLLESGDYEAARTALDGIGDTTAKAETVDGRTALTALWDDVHTKSSQEHIGLSTGLHELDGLLGGLVAGDLILLAARPSMGKTALMLNIAQNVDCAVGIFSLEMPTAKLMARMISAQGIDHGKLKRPKSLTDDDWSQMVKASKNVQDGLYINDVGGLSLPALESEARRMVNKHGVGMICIDYLQLVTCKAEKRLEVVSEVSRRLKALAKNLKVPVIALSQLNRESENRVNPVITLAQLRESGQLEQDADVVIFIDRPEVKDSQHRPGEADLIVAKNRDGEIGTAVVAWQGQFQRFVNKSFDWYERSSA